MQTENRVIVIAEAGVNHNGDMQQALKLVDAAADCGADYVKFQTFSTELLCTSFAERANYQKNEGENNDQISLLKGLELSYSDFAALKIHCSAKNIGFLSTGFDDKSLDFLDSLDLDFAKIPSGEITNLPLLRRIASRCKPLLLSTGMCSIGEIETALDTLLSHGLTRELITVLHCSTEYPTAFEDVNLKAMKTIQNTFGVSIGYSDHSVGIEVAIAAVALGARVIEKHFTLDKTSPGPDHRSSLEPHEFKQMTSAIRNIERALGDGRKRPTTGEILNREIARKSIVAKSSIKQGELFTSENIICKRPGTGISPMRWDEIIGRSASRAYSKDELIEL